MDGIRLQLLIGREVPLPAPFPIIDALRTVEVTNRHSDRDGFQIEFALGKDGFTDYSLLQTGVLDPPARVIIMVVVGATPQVLIDGIITDQQVSPTNRPAESRLRVTGLDISLRMDLEERSVTYSNQSDSAIVTQLIGRYARYGLVPRVTQTSDVRSDEQGSLTQQGTDFAYIQRLAKRNGFVFYLEPTAVPGVTNAYWGSDRVPGAPQPALTLSMGGQSNVDTPLVMRFDALSPESPEVTVLEANTGVAVTLPVPSLGTVPMASRAAQPLRRTIARDAAHLSPARGALRALTASARGQDAVVVNGEVDAVRYGRVLRARRMVGVRGVGETFGGFYFVQEVTHRIRRGEYKQSFSLAREGKGATTPLVPS
jgi:hypothetical protein